MNSGGNVSPDRCAHLEPGLRVELERVDENTVMIEDGEISVVVGGHVVCPLVKSSTDRNGGSERQRVRQARRPSGRARSARSRAAIRRSEQGVGDLFHRDRSLAGVADEHSAEERIKRLGCLCGHQVGIDRADLVEHLEQVVGGEGRLAGAELVEEYPQREDIAGQGRGLAADLLGGQVARGAEETVAGLGEAQVGRLVGVGPDARDAGAGQAEVEDLDEPSAVTITFSGFRSPCTIPSAWAAAIPEAIWRAIDKSDRRKPARTARSSTAIRRRYIPC